MGNGKWKYNVCTELIGFCIAKRWSEEPHTYTHTQRHTLFMTHREIMIYTCIHTDYHRDYQTHWLLHTHTCLHAWAHTQIITHRLSHTQIIAHIDYDTHLWHTWVITCVHTHTHMHTLYCLTHLALSLSLAKWPRTS